MRSATLFLLAILAPCLVLGWLSWRSMRDEESVIRRRQTAYYQQSADAAAREAAIVMQAFRQEFGRAVERLLAEGSSPEETALRFHTGLKQAWPAAQTGFVLDGISGRVIPQVEPGEMAVTAFLVQHPWLSSAGMQKLTLDRGEVWTSLAASVREQPEGMITRDEPDATMHILWHRNAMHPEYVYAAALDSGAMRRALAALEGMQAPDDEATLLLLDARGQVAARWGRSGVLPAADMIASRDAGPVLPGWRAAVVLHDPLAFLHQAAGARWRLGMVVAVASLAAAAGAGFILRDVRRSRREARQKTDFVSSVSHEFRTPLTSIRMFSDMLQAADELPDEKRIRYAGIISTEAARLSRLISNVLCFSRMERGSLPLHRAAVDLTALVRTTVEGIRPELEKAGAGISLDLPDGPVPLSGDADAISQVLLNLLCNAGKYGHVPGRPQLIQVAVESDPEKVTLTVSDNGAGIPSGHEERIFDEFHRAHDALASGTAGSGLGLTIARRLALAHGGSLSCGTSAAGGAAFFFMLPLHPLHH